MVYNKIINLKRYLLKNKMATGWNARTCTDGYCFDELLAPRRRSHRKRPIRLLQEFVNSTLKTTTVSLDYSVLNIDLNMTSYLTLNSMLSRMWQATLMGSPRRGRPRSAILSSSLKSSGASSTNFLNSTFSPSCKNRRKNTTFRQSDTCLLIRMHLVDI